MWIQQLKVIHNGSVYGSDVIFLHMDRMAAFLKIENESFLNVFNFFTMESLIPLDQRLLHFFRDCLEVGVIHCFLTKGRF